MIFHSASGFFAEIREGGCGVAFGFAGTSFWIVDEEEDWARLLSINHQ